MSYRACVLAILVMVSFAGVAWGEGKWTNYSSGNNIRALAAQGKYVWAGTTGGVVRWDTETGNYVKYTTTDGLADNTIHSIAIDKQGALWFGTQGSGVSKFEEHASTRVSDSQGPNHPESFGIRAAYPNPFNPSTTIDFTLSRPGKTTLSVYGVSGQLVETLADGMMSAGTHSIIWNAARRASGVYLVTLESRGMRDTRKVLFIK